MPMHPQGAPAPAPAPAQAPVPPAGGAGGGMLQRAASNAAQVSGGQGLPGMPQPSPDQSLPLDAEGVPGQKVDQMPESGKGGAAYQGEAVNLAEEQPTAAEEKEYQRIAGAMQKVLYGQDTIADAIMQQVDPHDKISTTTKAATLLIQQLDEKLDMDEIVIPQITMDAVDVVAELAENRFGIQYSEQEIQATLGATWEGVMAIFGVDEREYDQLIQENEGQLDMMQKSYDGFLAQGEPAQHPAQAAGPAAPPAAPTQAPPPPGAAPGAAPVPMPPGAPPTGGVPV